MNLALAQDDFDSAKKRLKRVRRCKRAFDSAVLIASSPVVLPIGLIVSAAVRIYDGSPVLFRQKRIGLSEVPFEILKFRTMDPGDGRNGDSARITKLGRVLRKTSLDELPQLWNVLRGDMSLVGPRPLYPEYLPYYSKAESIRHQLRPGITGLAQVSGRNSLRWSSRLASDRKYVLNASLREDLRILLQTLGKSIKREGVAGVPRDTGEPLNVERSYPRHSGYAMRRFNLLDVPLRVQWTNNAQIREHMQIPFWADEASMEVWYHRTKLDKYRDDFVVCRESDDEPVAMLGLKGQPGSSRGVLYVFVSPDRVGEGIGFISMTLLIRWATASRFESVTLSVGEQNQAAWKLYERLGFRRVDDTAEGRRSYELEVSCA